MASNNKLSRESAPKYRQEYLAQNIRLREVFYICTDVQLYSTSAYLYPHPIISPLTLPSVQRRGKTMIKKNMPNLKKPKKMRRAHQTFRPSTGVLSSYI